MGRLVAAFPLRALRSYALTDGRADLVAGLTTAILLIPQAMAYAMLAGLPPVMGLYAAAAPLVAYALLGSSRELAVGPSALVALLTGAAVATVAPAGSPSFAQAATTLALLVGLIQLGMGALRLGVLTNLLNHPILSGFTSAAAVLIVGTQLPHLLGVHVPRARRLDETISLLAGALPHTHAPTLAVGIASLAGLLALKRWAPRAPRALLVIGGATTLSAWLGWDAAGIAVVGPIPGGLPGPALPTLQPEILGTLAPSALAVALVGFMGSVSVAQHFARRGGYEIHPDRELLGLGAANIAAALFRAFPVSGGFGRSAVNAEAGARTRAAALTTAAVVAVAVELFAPTFEAVPKASLAALIIAAVASLVDLDQVRHLWRAKRDDLALLTVTFVATLELGPERGIAVGVGLSLLWFATRSMRPHRAILGRLPNSMAYRNVERFPEAETFPGIAILRIDGQCWYGNARFFKRVLLEAAQSDGAPVRALVVDASAVNRLDSSGAEILSGTLDELQALGVVLHVAAMKGPVRDVVEATRLGSQLPPERTHLTLHEAVEAARAGL